MGTNQLFAAAQRARDAAKAKLMEAAILDDAAVEIETITAEGGFGSILRPYLFFAVGDKVRACTKDTGPDVALRLLEALPPSARMWHYRRDGKAGFVSEGDKRIAKMVESKHLYATFEEVEPVLIRVTEGYGPSVTAEWSHILPSGRHLDLDVGLVSVHGVTPRMIGATRTYSTGRVVAIENVGIDLGCVPKNLWHASGGRIQRYASGARDQWPTFTMYGIKGDGDGANRMMLAHLANEMTQRGVATLAAYERDKALGVAILGTAESHEQHVIATTNYDTDSLRSGTRKQHECLQTVEALADRLLASRHWPAYANEHGIAAELSGRNFSHYTWACSWLKRHNLLEDPGLMVNDMAGNGKPYRYGSAWL